jgi:hypothetical protein
MGFRSGDPDLHTSSDVACVNHRVENTTSLSGGYQSLVKSFIRGQGSEKMRLDRIIYNLWNFVADANKHKDVMQIQYKLNGSVQAHLLRALTSIKRFD